MGYDPKRVTIFILVLVLLGVGGYYGYQHVFHHTKSVKTPHTVTSNVPSNTLSHPSVSKTVSKKPTVAPQNQQLDLTAFQTAWNNKDWKKADSLLASEIKAHPYDTNLDIQAAEYYEQRNNHDPSKSISFLQGILKKHPKDAMLRVNLAYFQTESKNVSDYSTALQNAEQALNEEQAKVGNNGQVPVFFYDTYAWADGLDGNATQAFNIYVNNIFKVYKFDDPSSMLHFGLLLESNGNYAYAKQVFQKVQGLQSSQLPSAQASELTWAQTNAKAALARIPKEQASANSTAKSTSNTTSHSSGS